jgi:hypothetical protein
MESPLLELPSLVNNMDVLEILKTIKDDWALLVFVFGLGAAWWQGKMWFSNVNRNIAQSNQQHSELSAGLNEIKNKVDNIDQRLNKIDDTVCKVHDQIHDHEIKLAVIENSSQRKTRAAAR